MEQPFFKTPSLNHLSSLLHRTQGWSCRGREVEDTHRCEKWLLEAGERRINGIYPTRTFCIWETGNKDFNRRQADEIKLALIEQKWSQRTQLEILWDKYLGELET